VLWFLHCSARHAGAVPAKNRFGPAHEKILGYSQNTQDKTMEAERINLIGNNLSDLAVRTQELRRYL